MNRRAVGLAAVPDWGSYNRVHHGPNPGLTTIEALTPSPMDSDGDGIPDDEDKFPHSNTDPAFNVEDILVTENVQLEGGAGLADEIAFALAADVDNREFVQDLQAWRDAGFLIGREMGQIPRAHNTN